MTAQNPIDFIHDLNWQKLPQHVQQQARLCLLDLLAIAAGGRRTRLSGIVREYAVAEYPGTLPIMFDGRGANGPGLALATGMTIDSLDGHDGFNPAKGHIGCPLFGALYAEALARPITGEAMLEAIVVGYEIGARASVAQHGTVPDYHTSGSWGAVAAAAALARLRDFDAQTTRHALGIAEYHGPRSQMMRCIDHPTMLKDGAGWGALCAVSAVGLAEHGFTGAPAITVEDAPEYWGDLGTRWYIMEQYFKPYPVCRWAQAPIEGVLELKRKHDLSSDMVDHIEVTTFHESNRLAMKHPRTSDEAQYSTSFPCAVAMVRGDVQPADVAEDALQDAEILRLSDGMVMTEDDHANENFPTKRLARVTLHLKDGRTLESGWKTPLWDAVAPPTEEELRGKFRKYAGDVLGERRAAAIEQAVDALEQSPASDLMGLLAQPINP